MNTLRTRSCLSISARNFLANCSTFFSAGVGAERSGAFLDGVGVVTDEAGIDRGEIGIGRGGDWGDNGATWRRFGGAGLGVGIGRWTGLGLRFIKFRKRMWWLSLGRAEPASKNSKSI